MPNCEERTQLEETCMISVVYRNIRGMWYGAAVEAGKVLACLLYTSDAADE